MKLYCCSSCNHWFSGEEKEKFCSECRGILIPIDYDYDSYNAMSNEEKERFRNEYTENNHLNDAINSPTNIILNEIYKEMNTIKTAVLVLLVMCFFVILYIMLRYLGF
ncbi:hypothetical protein lbkm_0704 [Lachnospiraceae bacterium KM106-2]|nr:hypothetical protein lbkm_0704 [Lachnospiraceae bacterium KM106-2]